MSGISRGSGLKCESQLGFRKYPQERYQYLDNDQQCSGIRGLFEPWKLKPVIDHHNFYQ